MKDFRKLKVWEKSHRLTLEIYKVSAQLPSSERYGLADQIRRASASIPANIAEGCGRSTDGDQSRLFQIAMGSASELDYHLLVASDLGYLSAEEHEKLSNDLVEVKKMLSGLLTRLRSSGRTLRADR
jgi:four helix bundle protein